MNARPKQFLKVATALGFSPMSVANLAEVHRIAMRFNADLFVFHVGDWTKENQASYDNFLSELGIEPSSITLKCRQGDPKVEL